MHYECTELINFIPSNILNQKIYYLLTRNVTIRIPISSKLHLTYQVDKPYIELLSTALK